MDKNKEKKINELIQGRKVLVAGLGILGGGLATTNWLLKHRAVVTVTDLKKKAELKGSLSKIKLHGQKIKYTLGNHVTADFKNNEIIVANPGMPLQSPYLNASRQSKRQIVNEASLFFKFNTNPAIAVTGTRGKTTTVNWIGHILEKSQPSTIVGGNSSDVPMLSFLDILKENQLVVLELGAWQLELVKEKGPKVAVITNLYPDHLNRYITMAAYAMAKSNIFLSQNINDYLILNKDNSWTNFFLSLKPKSHIYFVSFKKLPKRLNGLYVSGNNLYFKEGQKITEIINIKDFRTNWGGHNLMNLMEAMLSTHLYGLSWTLIKSAIKNLPQISLRQENVYQKKGLTIINDSTGTSPDATVAALKRFCRPGINLILLTGGTDKNLDYRELALTIKAKVPKNNLVLFNGSGTRKLIELLSTIHYSQSFLVLETLEECLKGSLVRLKGKNNIILFSPAGASFEKFKNEFDRGTKFNETVTKLLN
ncbi:MAG TPA: UDP-N-acetylmuramoyl-L-alanine--D-glutamate ligase [Patescibacteria group bacterium]